MAAFPQTGRLRMMGKGRIRVWSTQGWERGVGRAPRDGRGGGVRPTAPSQLPGVPGIGGLAHGACPPLPLFPHDVYVPTPVRLR